METYHIRKFIHKLPGHIIHSVPLPKPQVTEGYGSRGQIGEVCRNSGYKSVLVVTDKTLRSLGYEQAVMQSLEKAGVACSLFAEIDTEPNIPLIDAGREAAKACNAECIVALGGGSVLDTCKMIAAGAKMPHLHTRFLLRRLLIVSGKTLPMISVPSTAGTGAEITVAAVVKGSRGVKGSTVLIGLNVTHVFLDSELTVHAPKMVTAACAIDALSHCIEGVVSDVKVSDADMGLSLEGIKLILHNLPIIMREPENSEARLSMCRAAMYGGNAINTQLAGYVHAFAHSIGSKYHISHGQAIALAMMPVLRHQFEFCKAKYALAARYCGLSDGLDDIAAEQLLQAFERLMADCGLDKIEKPVRTEDVEELTGMITADSINYSSAMTFSKEDIEQVLKQITHY